MLVLPLAARVDERRLASMLHTERSRVRLAPAASLVPLCGYTVGNVPPFGHRSRLPVIVDASVPAFDSCYAGGGSDKAEVLIAVPELLRATGATVADIAVVGSRPSGSSGGGRPSVPVGSAAGQRAAADAAALPAPWQAGQVDVVLEGVVAQRRKIARLLMFVSLVPLPAQLPEGGSSTAAGAGTAATQVSREGDSDLGNMHRVPRGGYEMKFVGAQPGLCPAPPRQ